METMAMKLTSGLFVVSDHCSRSGNFVGSATECQASSPRSARYSARFPYPATLEKQRQN